jgi:hypothetical protein
MCVQQGGSLKFLSAFEQRNGDGGGEIDRNSNFGGGGRGNVRAGGGGGGGGGWMDCRCTIQNPALSAVICTVGTSAI